MRELEGVEVEVVHGEAMSIRTDVLLLKHAQELYGVDRAAVAQLKDAYPSIRAQLPSDGEWAVFSASGSAGPSDFLFVGTPDLIDFDYEAIRHLSRDALRAIAAELPKTEHLSLTLHGPGFGLDERESLLALLAGLHDGLRATGGPRLLRRISFVEADRGRAERMLMNLDSFVSESNAVELGPSVDAAVEETRRSVFVAMPFEEAFVDTYHYGIAQPLQSLGYIVERIDKSVFTGDIVAKLLSQIEASDLVVADLSGANANVYLEVGYAWALRKATVLLARNVMDLKFDTKGHRCLEYGTAHELSQLLTAEVSVLMGGA